MKDSNSLNLAEYSTDAVYRIKQHLASVGRIAGFPRQTKEQKLIISSPKLYSRCWYGYKSYEQFNYTWYSYDVPSFTKEQCKNIYFNLTSPVLECGFRSCPENATWIGLMNKGMEDLDSGGFDYLRNRIDALRDLLSRNDGSTENIIRQELHHLILSIYSSYPTTGLLPSHLWKIWVNWLKNNQGSPRVVYVQLSTNNDLELPQFTFSSDIEGFSCDQLIEQEQFDIALNISNKETQKNKKALNFLFLNYLRALFRDQEYDAKEMKSVSQSIADSNLIGFLYIPIYLTTGSLTGKNEIGDWLGLLEYDIRTDSNNKTNYLDLAKEWRNTRIESKKALKIINEYNQSGNTSEKLSDIAKDLFLGNGYQISISQSKGLLKRKKSLTKAISKSIGWTPEESLIDKNELLKINKPYIWIEDNYHRIIINPYWNLGKTTYHLDQIFSFKPALHSKYSERIFHSLPPDSVNEFGKRFYLWTRILSEQITGTLNAQLESLTELKTEQLNILTHELQKVVTCISKVTNEEALKDIRKFLKFMLSSSSAQNIGGSLSKRSTIGELISYSIDIGAKYSVLKELATEKTIIFTDDYVDVRNREIELLKSRISIADNQETNSALGYQFTIYDKVKYLKALAVMLISTITNHAKHEKKYEGGRLCFNYNTHSNCIEIVSKYTKTIIKTRKIVDRGRKEVSTIQIIHAFAQRIGRYDIEIENIFISDKNNLRYTFFVPLPNEFLLINEG